MAEVGQKEAEGCTDVKEVAEFGHKESNITIDWEKVKGVSQNKAQSDMGGEEVAEAEHKVKSNIDGFEEPMKKTFSITVAVPSKS